MRRMIDERTPPHFGGALNPVDIISRASDLVPENREADDRFVPARPIVERRPAAEPSPEAVPVLPTAKSRRRTMRLFVVRSGDIFRFALRYALPAVLLVAVPLWLWSGGHVEDAQRFVERQVDGVSAWTTDAFGLHVTSVRVRGRDQTSAAELRTALGINQGASMLEVDIDDVRARIEALPWVERAIVQRRLPNRLDIHLVERTPIARIAMNSAIYLVDASGTVIRSAPGQEHDRLVLLRGTRAAEEAAPLVALLESLPSLGGRVVAAHRFGDRRWDLRFDSGVVVKLPEGLERAAWQRLARLQSRFGLLERAGAVLDMRLPDRLVIRTGGTDGQEEG